MRQGFYAKTVEIEVEDLRGRTHRLTGIGRTSFPWQAGPGTVGFNVLAAPAHISTAVIVGVVLLGIVAEVLEFTIAGRYTKQYGGSRRAGWGAILGGFVGAFVGIPIPIVGSVIGGFLGAFAGALVAEWSRRDASGSPVRVATGALIGRAVGAAIKCAFGLVIAVCLVIAAMA